MAMHHDHPRNIILMQKALQKVFDQHKWTVLHRQMEHYRSACLFGLRFEDHETKASSLAMRYHCRQSTLDL